MAKITISVEVQRGCGYRKAGKNGYGVYIMADAPSAPCGRLPFLLMVCPCCGEGVKPSRGFTWIQPGNLFSALREIECGSPLCYACPLGDSLWGHDKAGLIWIGEKFYPTSEHFRIEAQRQGISRKLPAIPNDFEIGKTWVYFAHRKCIPYKDAQGEMQWYPGVFMAVRPKYIDLVIDDAHNVPAYAEKTQEKYGEDKVRIVKVIRDYETQQEIELVD